MNHFCFYNNWNLYFWPFNHTVQSIWMHTSKKCFISDSWPPVLFHSWYFSVNLPAQQSVLEFLLLEHEYYIYIYIFVTILNVSFCHALQRFIVLLYAKVLLHFKVPQLHSHSALFSLWSAPPGRYAHTLSPASNNITCHFFDNSLTRILGSRLCQLT